MAKQPPKGPRPAQQVGGEDQRPAPPKRPAPAQQGGGGGGAVKGAPAQAPQPAANIRSTRRGNVLTTSVDPSLAPVIKPASTVSDQLAALLNSEGREMREPMPGKPSGPPVVKPAAAPRSSGVFGAAPVRPSGGYEMPSYAAPPRRSSSAEAAEEAENYARIVAAQTASRPVPKKYVSIAGGAYLVDDYDKVPMAMRPNTQINTAGYTPKAEVNAGDDLMAALMASYAARQAGAQTDILERQKQQFINQGYGRF